MMSRMKSRPASRAAVPASVMLPESHSRLPAAYLPNPRARAKTASRETFDALVSLLCYTTFSTARTCRAGCDEHLCSNLGPLTLWRRAGTATKFTRHDRDRRHPLCSLAHGLPAYRRGAHRAVQLALRPRTRRQDAAADRGHRPRALDRGGDRGDPRRPLLARHRLGRRRHLPVLARRAPPRGGRSSCWPRATPIAAMPVRKSLRRCARRRARRPRQTL